MTGRTVKGSQTWHAVVADLDAKIDPHLDSVVPFNVSFKTIGYILNVNVKEEVGHQSESALSPMLQQNNCVHIPFACICLMQKFKRQHGIREYPVMIWLKKWILFKCIRCKSV